MEKAINQHSAICAYNFMRIILVVWGICAIITQQKLGIPLYFFIAQAIVSFISKQVSRHQAGDERGKRYLIYLASIVLTILFIFFFVIPMSLIGVGMEETMKNYYFMLLNPYSL